MIVYSELHPVSPGIERLLARIAHMTAIGGGVKVSDESMPFEAHLVRKYPTEN
ncbi:hypothetical protein P3W24_04010 [Luteibacter sp. PPL201]|uniref:Uncharacterized protein n=1 Tax=Luteibacter sahnii TaxID=3021977 RepID=A0ABT6B7T0_9GAMM